MVSELLISAGWCGVGEFVSPGAVSAFESKNAETAPGETNSPPSTFSMTTFQGLTAIPRGQQKRYKPCANHGPRAPPPDAFAPCPHPA
eukprot:2274755-Prymnesium_polylepis.1